MRDDIKVVLQTWKLHLSDESYPENLTGRQACRRSHPLGTLGQEDHL